MCLIYVYMYIYFKSIAPSILFYSLSSKHSLMAAVRTENLLKCFQRDHYQGKDHTQTSSLHPELLSQGQISSCRLCCVLVHAALLYTGKARASAPAPMLAAHPQHCCCLGLGAGALFPDQPECTSPLTHCGPLSRFPAVF